MNTINAKCYRFYLILYFRTHPSTAEEQLLDYNNVSSITSSSFVGTRKTKVIIHGFTHHGHKQWLQNMAQAFLKKVCCLIFMFYSYVNPSFGDGLT